ncbi:MAG: hypothetical protein ACOCRO_07320, partial [Halanaerobiales bacterium]
MARDVSSTLKENLKRRNNKLEKEIWVDWNNDGNKDDNELIENDVLQIRVDQQKEGKVGISVVDRSTVDFDNSEGNFSPKNLDSKWSGNVIPTRDTEISLGVDGEKVNIFSGIIKSIDPNYTDYTGSLTIDDKISLLQEEDAPDVFYYDIRPEQIIEAWLQSVGITNYNLEKTKYIINYNFNGMKMWQAIQMINEATQGYTYMQDNVFYFKTRLSLDYNGEDDVIHTFYHEKNNEENVWEITGSLGATDMFNKVSVES